MGIWNWLFGKKESKSTTYESKPYDNEISKASKKHTSHAGMVESEKKLMGYSSEQNLKVDDTIKSSELSDKQTIIVGKDVEKITKVVPSVVKYSEFVIKDAVKKYRLNTGQRMVYEALNTVSEATDSEIAKLCMFAKNTVRGRRYELYKIGLVYKGAKRTCKVTGNIAQTYFI